MKGKLYVVSADHFLSKLTASRAEIDDKIVISTIGLSLTEQVVDGDLPKEDHDKYEMTNSMKYL